MARSIAEIKNQMLVEKANQPSLSGLNSPSQVAIWNMLFYIVAFAINIFEQLLDVFNSQQSALALAAVPGTDNWVQRRTLEFQYDATNVQYLTLNTTTLSVGYSQINTAYQIITRCSVRSIGQGICNIKVAKSSPPEALSALEKSALENYWNPNVSNSYGFAGVNYIIISDSADEIEIVGTIFFNGQFSSIISTNVIAALNTYLANLPFDGNVSINAIEDAIQSVTGVNQVKLTEVNLRRNSDTYGTGTVMYNLATGINIVQIGSFAGYVIEETTSGHTFTDTLTFVAQ